MIEISQRSPERVESVRNALIRTLQTIGNLDFREDQLRHDLNARIPGGVSLEEMVHDLEALAAKQWAEWSYPPTGGVKRWKLTPAGQALEV